MIDLDVVMLSTWLKTLLWPFVRVSAMFMTAPIFSSASVPIRVRIALGFLIAWAVAPLVTVPDIEVVSVAGFLVTINQVLIGLLMGFLIQLTFTAIVIAGQTIAMTTGLGFAMAVDPGNGVQVPVVSQFMLILGTLLFLGLDGHLLLIMTLAQSFSAVPVSIATIDVDAISVVLQFMGQVFVMALAMALPVLVAVLTVNLSLGVVTRAAPQLNIFAVGFPITILVGFLMMLLSLDVFQAQATALFSAGFSLLTEIVR